MGDGPARLTRRRFLASAGAAGAAAASFPPSGAAARRETTAGATVAFWGRHQPGIELAQQRHTLVAALDLVARDTRELRRVLRAWSSGAARMTVGELVAHQVAPRLRLSVVARDEAGAHRADGHGAAREVRQHPHGVEGDHRIVGAGLHAQVAAAARGLEALAAERGQRLERSGPAATEPA